MSDLQPTLESLMQNVKTLQDQVQAMQAALAKAGLMTVEEGIVGVYEGDFMVSLDGQRIQVPANYASKTMLVSGDQLRMIEGVDGGQAKFKQIGKAERLKTEGLLAKKDGKFEVLTEQGSFKVLAAAVKHYEGQPGDKVMIQYAKQHVKGSWAAIEKIVSSNAPAAEGSVMAGAINLPSSNIVQIKHAPVEPVQAEAAAPVSSPSESTQAEPKTSGQTEPKNKQEKPAEHKAVEHKTPTQSSSKPQSASNKSSRKSSAKSVGREQAGSKSSNRPAGHATSQNKSGQDRNKPKLNKPRVEGETKPASQPAPKTVEQSLPLDKGEIMPMVEYDDDELM